MRKCVTLRPRRYVTLVSVSATSGLGVLFLVRVIQTGQPWPQYLLPTAMLIGAALAALNFFRFCYFRVTESGIERVNYFGLSKLTVPQSALLLVDVRTQRNAVQQVVPSLVLTFAEKSIELSAAKYRQGELVAAAAQLLSMGVPGTSGLSHALQQFEGKAFTPRF